MKKNNFQYLLFFTMLIVGSSSLSVSNTIMKTYPSSAFLIFIILIGLIILPIFIIKINKKNLKFILNSNISKILILVYLIISSLIFILSYLKITNDYFYQITPPIIIISIILLSCIFFSTYGIKNIINIAFVLFLLIIFSKVFTFLNTTKYDFSLLNNHIIKFDQIWPIFGYLYIYYDIIIIFIFVSFKDNVKNTYFISSIISLLINSFLILQNYFFFDSKYFIEGRYPFLLNYLVLSNNRYFEHFDILYLIFITIFLFIRLSLNIEIFRITLKIKRNNYLIFIFPVILIILAYLSSFIKVDNNLFNLLMLISTIFLSFFLIYHYFLVRRSKK